MTCMCRAIAYLHAGNMDEASKDLATCAAIIEATESAPESQQEGQHQLRAPYFMTYVAMSIASGKMGQLKQGEVALS
jgi:hypothetical protein